MNKTMQSNMITLSGAGVIGGRKFSGTKRADNRLD